MTDILTLLTEGIDAAAGEELRQADGPTPGDIAVHLSETILEDRWRRLDPAAADVVAERLRQQLVGYTPDHDDAEGFQHLNEIMQGYLSGKLYYARDELVKGAATVLAMIEWLDRNA